MNMKTITLTKQLYQYHDMVEVVIALEPYERSSTLNNGTTETTSARNRGSATPLLNNNSDRLQMST